MASSTRPRPVDHFVVGSPTNRLLQQRDQTEPRDLDVLSWDSTPHLTVCGKVPVPEGGPVEMSAVDRCGFDVGSFFELNQGLDQVAREERWTLGDVDPESVDLSAESLADYRFAIAKPLPPLKTEVKPFKSATAFAKQAAPVRFRSASL